MTPKAVPWINSIQGTTLTLQSQSSHKIEHSDNINSQSTLIYVFRHLVTLTSKGTIRRILGSG